MATNLIEALAFAKVVVESAHQHVPMSVADALDLFDLTTRSYLKFSGASQADVNVGAVIMGGAGLNSCIG